MLNIKQNQQPLDENYERHGEWLYYHNNGKLWYRENYVHGISHGLHEGYFKDGKLKWRGYWNMGRQVRYWYWHGKKRYYLCLV